MTEADLALEAALDAFAARGALVDRDELSPLLATRGAAAAARDERFSHGMRRTTDVIAGGGAAALESLAFAWRVTSVTSMREHRRRLVDELGSGLVRQEFGVLPTTMQDPEDRRHFADALFHVPAAWKAGYLARAIAAEREGERARESLCRALLASQPVLADEISSIDAALASEAFDQLEPEVGRARRATLILDALSTAMWSQDADVEPGEFFGEALSQFATRILLRRAPSDRGVSNQFAARLVNFVVVAARLHGSLAADAAAYAFLGPLRRAMGAGGWPDLVQNQMIRAAAQVLDQLLLLAKLRMPDANLRRVYVAMVGEPHARRILSSDRAGGLDADMAHWLAMGTALRTMVTGDAVSETAMATVDADVGSALRDAELVEEGLRRILPELRSAADFHSAALAEQLGQVAERMGRLATHVRDAARKRNLVLHGVPGDVVDFSPAQHQPTPRAIGERTVRLVGRGVERVVEGRSVGVVLKADVDKA